MVTPEPAAEPAPAADPAPTTLTKKGIIIGGNVYGGGNQAKVEGNTRVTVKAGDIKRVYGGARMADVGGNAFVHIDGEHATDYTVIDYVFGGNDISGTVGSDNNVKVLPDELTHVAKTDADKSDPKKNEVDKNFDAYVRVSSPAADNTRTVKNADKEFTEDVTKKKEIYIGQLFAGGNGEYDLVQEGGTFYIYHKGDRTTAIAQNTTGFNLPIINKTYLEVVGGSIVYAYGGGNNATVSEKTIIYYDNPSDVVNHIEYQKENGDWADKLTNERFLAMGINTSFSKPSSDEFQVGRFFGGNNMAEMAIRPRWNLQSGKIRNLYSGGNKGAMTSPEGLLLEINPASSNTNPLVIDYVYGGCRMADVKPTVNGVYTPCTNLQDKDGEGNLIYHFPDELSARVLVRGGDINNVYGGNDVTGKVYGGNAVGVYSSIRGDLYGGGNGAYPYTDKADFANNPSYSDLFYGTQSDAAHSVEALNAYRPNAEQVSIRIAGSAGSGGRPNYTIIGGSVYVGGNCATLQAIKPKPMVELKVGSYAIADNVFLGNNGAGMIDEDILKHYAGVYEKSPGNPITGFSSLDLTDAGIFASYMSGAAMSLQPALVFDDTNNGDPATYIANSSYFGSFYCGGNVGSMMIPEKNTYRVDKALNIYTKFVGGCNAAYVPEKWTGPDNTGTQLCAAYDGGVLGSASEQADYTDASGNIKDRLNIKLENMTITPLRWKDETDKSQGLIWNTVRWFDDDGGTGFRDVPNSPVDENNRLQGGNVYGGCYESGHVNGNIVIDINEDVLERDEVFGTGFSTVFGRTKSGVEFLDQRDDLNSVALIVFGGGYGVDSEVWGSTTVNHNKGYVFQICGGGEMGVVGKYTGTTTAEDGTLTIDSSTGQVTSYASNGKTYAYNPKYSSTVNLQGSVTATSNEGAVANLAETEYIYAGGKEGLVCGNTLLNLGNGRIYDAFGGACEADILGHSETYIGRQPDGSGSYIDGFPWVQDIVYGGNDFTGTIYGKKDFKDRVRVETGADAFDVLGKVHKYNASTNSNPDVLVANAYVEYLQGRVDTIFGGNYGYYDYADKILWEDDNTPSTMPSLESSFVNIRPNPENKSDNAILAVFGGGTGYPGNRDGDRTQNRSYVLVDIPDNISNFSQTQFFGAGSYSGMGMNSKYDATSHKTLDENNSPVDDLDNLSCIIDLVRGKVGAAYGGSFNEGVTRRTMVNVPAGSTIQIGSIFGGAYGNDLLAPCDVYEAHVNYSSSDALMIYNSENELMKGAIYGGNNTCRRTLYGFIDINAPVWQQHPKWGKTRANVYGAGYGPMTWSEYTQVNLNDKAEVYEVYGGAQNGEVLNAESAKAFMNSYLDSSSPTFPSFLQAIFTARGYTDTDWRTKVWPDAWTLGEGYYTPYTYDEGQGLWVFTAGNFDSYVTNEATNLSNPVLARRAEMDDRDYSDGRNKVSDQYKYNTNVIINEGAYVANYAYGGGLGTEGMTGTGDVYGTTYIALLGGTVNKDIYAAGTVGAIHDNYESNEFIASSNAYIQGGTCRNVYGGGWQGSVGKHLGTELDPKSVEGDVLGETHVVIGDLAGDSFINGIPAIQRNAYGGGEGGAVYGTAHLTLNNGYVGYQYNAESGKYEEKIEDNTQPTPNTLLTDAGCLFGGGYIDNSSVDKTKVYIYGGQVRNSAFGGGEVAAIGRGDMKLKSGSTTTYELNKIYRPGKTNIEMYSGHVHRNVFGGGRGYNNLGAHGSLHCDGYVFGQTEVHIHGGEIGTVSGLADGDGNVFGGCDVGFVYSALEDPTDGKFYKGVKIGQRYGEDDHQGYYFKHDFDDAGAFIMSGSENIFTEDCKVLIEPHLKAKEAVTINGKSFTAGEYVPIEYLNKLKNKTTDATTWAKLDQTGIIIHNAVFAGGNSPSGGALSANTASVFGNATASINDIYHRDMITLGTRNTGGLYGDGNLTLVDGYRELNITNYGTDYYSIAKTIDIGDYNVLPDRERDYYELKYTCLKECKDKENTRYRPATETSKASTITADDMQTLFVKKTIDGQGKVIGEESVKDEYGKAILKWDETEGEWVPNDVEGTNYWEKSGVLPVYAGRLMNSIQRADFCGVFGSRMVMKGAQDRVPEIVDYTNYTINRVREVSLNKKNSVIDGDATPFHGNYFGIYNVVNYLGALTSDVKMSDIRVTENDNAERYIDPKANGHTYGIDASYLDWKQQFIHDRRRNNGSSYNKLALASGVYLELTTEKSTGDGLFEKDWGPITGVVELDLINVSTGLGGGYVYAKNEHGIPSTTGYTNTTLTALNENAVTQWDYTYDTTDDETHQKEWETSGNFVHSTQTIIDDCYNVSNRYMGEGKMPAHFWYIKGSVYVYDQYISAYTGTPNAYSEKVDIPLSISSASYGKLTLLDVQQNRYAYYASPGVELEAGKRIIINDKSYYKNDPISYWDWYLLSPAERGLFIENTYVNFMKCKIDDTEYDAGTYVLTEDQYKALTGTTYTYTDAEGSVIMMPDGKTAANDQYIFRPSNIVSHDKGYILTYEVNNPALWDNWYTPKSDTDGSKITLATYETKSVTDQEKYHNGPTYRLKATTGGEVLGQREYKVGDVISATVKEDYEQIVKDGGSYPSDPVQATFGDAYIVTKKINVTEGSSEHSYYPGVAVSKAFALSHSESTAPAYICTKSIQVTKEDIIFKDTKMTATEAGNYVEDVETKMTDTYKSMTIDEIKALPTTGSGAITVEKKKELIQLATVRDELAAYLRPAYYCETAGSYGGNYYKAGNNYRGLEAWSSLSEADHEKFIYNYDAFDLLIDPDFTFSSTSGEPYSEGHKYQYDGEDSDGHFFDTEEEARTNPAGYSINQSIDYTATYNSKTDSEELTKAITVIRNGTPTSNVAVLKKGDELSRETYESLINEQRHYAPIVVKNGKKEGTGESATYTVYVANQAFVVGGTPYALGETIASTTVEGFPDGVEDNVTTLVFTGSAEENKTYYYCRDSYTTTTDHKITSDNISGGTTCSDASTVPLGVVINADKYGALPNEQKNFTIHGVSPTETSTLYVSRESDIHDLSKDKIITVIYQYDYDEIDGSGNATPISERHVLNIHLEFKSGVPIVEDIDKPNIILPGDLISLRAPVVIPGATEISGYGWRLFENEPDAESHSNYIEYNPDDQPLYWYQDGYYVAYYAKSYQGGYTYSNHVPVSVANYHDLADVMSGENKEHHMYIDHSHVKRDPKIYINDYSASGKNGLDLFKSLYDLSLITGSSDDYTVSDDNVITAVASSGNSDLVGHSLLTTQTRAERNLEFFLRTDINHTGTWTPIGADGVCDNPATPSVDEGVAGKCFDGVFHGDGHTIRGLDHSLFNYLCGEVYNLGVTGSFTGAGVAENGGGYVESCWVKSSVKELPGGSSRTNAVFGNPSDGAAYQLVNSYFWDGNNNLYNTTTSGGITTSGGARGTARAMTEQEFYNGTVAYDLNSFYLNKRYYDKHVPSATPYNYWTLNADGSRADAPSTAYHPAVADNAQYCDAGYVEERYADGDFRYAAGEIPLEENERYYEHKTKDPDTGEETVVSTAFYPIWPDDYLFFGQKLTYGYSIEPHQEVPSAIAKSDGRLSQTTQANRVYRAPAYYRDHFMSMAHFNPDAYLAQKSSDGLHTAYPGMTAIDFAGHQGANEVNGTYGLGLTAATVVVPQCFYPPLLDDDGLQSIVNQDETDNLLVYAPAAASESGYANKQTLDVLSGYFIDPVYNDYYDNTGDNEGYRIVRENTSSIHGHLVQSNLIATNDHKLVDKMDFNAPMAYTFDESHRMWYQRTPDNQEYVDRSAGWQGISLPFTAELVTTNQKGEITHFYSGSHTSKNSDAKIGHEYWLREFKGIVEDSKVEDETTKYFARATFNYPDAKGATKTVTNHFLWDYYYENPLVHKQKDANDDTYLEYTQKYYKNDRTFSSYPLLANGTPYLLGLPGPTYYEFDLSGQFEALNTASAITQLGKQVITFASDAGASIGVSDSEMTGVTLAREGTNKNYTITYKPSYLNENLANGNYVMNSGGSAYHKLSDAHKAWITSGAKYADAEAFATAKEAASDKKLYTDEEGTTEATSEYYAAHPEATYYQRVGETTYNDHNQVTPSLSAFRPYFVATSTTKSAGVKGMLPEYIVFSGEYGIEDEPESAIDGSLEIFARGRTIITTSHMKEATTIRIVNVGGITLANFVLEPGKTVETPINVPGVYIVNQKKLSIK